MHRLKQSIPWAVIFCLISVFVALAEVSLDINTIEIIEDYQPGMGLPVGTVSIVQGQAVLVHLKETSG